MRISKSEATGEGKGALRDRGGGGASRYQPSSLLPTTSTSSSHHHAIDSIGSNSKAMEWKGIGGGGPSANAAINNRRRWMMYAGGLLLFVVAFGSLLVSSSGSNEEGVWKGNQATLEMMMQQASSAFLSSDSEGGGAEDSSGSSSSSLLLTNPGAAGADGKKEGKEKKDKEADNKREEEAEEMRKKEEERKEKAKEEGNEKKRGEHEDKKRVEEEEKKEVEQEEVKTEEEKKKRKEEEKKKVEEEEVRRRKEEEEKKKKGKEEEVGRRKEEEKKRKREEEEEVRKRKEVEEEKTKKEREAETKKEEEKKERKEKEKEKEQPSLSSLSTTAAAAQLPRRWPNNSREGGKIKKKNVLFLMADDLRPSLSNYGVPHVLTPNFDRLASISVTFERAYNQDPICNPSRNSLLSGRRPDTTQVWLFEDEYSDEYTGLFKMMREHGNHTRYGSGKLHHWINKEINEWESYWPDSSHAWNAGTDENYALMKGTVTPDKDWPEERFWDHRVASKGIEYLHQASEKVKEEDKPFFVGIGFHQPHRPWHIPQKYWDLYKDIDLPPPPHPNRPKNSPSVYVGDYNPDSIKMEDGSGHFYFNLDKDNNYPEMALKEQIRGYYASISFVDAQIGRILDALEEEGLVQDTLIVFCVDHGLNIGDHALWDKRTLLETTSRVPLLIHDPDYPETFGKSTSGLVENIDIYPTILESLGMGRHGEEVWPPLEGESLMPLLKDPVKGESLMPFLKDPVKGRTQKNVAVTQVPRCCQGCKNAAVKDIEWGHWHNCMGSHDEWESKHDKVLMGYSMRTDEWRYNMWMAWNEKTLLPRFEAEPEAEELYDHRDSKCNLPQNFDACEDENKADDSFLKEIKEKLRIQLTELVKKNNLQCWKDQKGKGTTAQS